MRNFMDRLTGHTRMTVNETQRLIVLRDGALHDILGAGEHRLAERGLKVEWHDLSNPRFTSPFADALERTRPELFAAHLTVAEGAADHVSVIFRNGQVVEVLRTPWARSVLWTDAGPWEVTRHSITDGLDVPETMRRHAVSGALGHAVVKATVDAGRQGVLFVDGEFVRALTPGVHFFWNIGRKVEVLNVDMRWREHEVNGQEILTADRVTLRVNISAAFRVTDAVAATTQVKDFTEALHLSAQLAFRKALGAKTLDQILAAKDLVDEEAANRVKAEMALIGVEVAALSLKDVILPGEMRTILNRVVEAEKAAEANVIRRREETNATRSLLNTAKVMAEHPVMLRLKELEALTEIAGKVERLTVHNGAEGLMNDLVKLRD
ncbi:MAG: slipin family protein [Pikeienuella sp.]